MEGFKKKIEKLGEEKIYKGSIFELYQNTLKIGDNIVKWDVIKHNGASAIVPVTNDGKILLVKQYRLSIDDYIWEIPAGKIEKDEDPLLAAKRELEEETGFKTDNLYHLCDMGTAYAYCNEIVHIYVARDLQEGKVNFDRDEDIISEFFEIEKIKQMIFDGTITDSKTILSIMTYLVKENL